MKYLVLFVLLSLSTSLSTSLSLSTSTSLIPSSEHVENSIIKVNGMKCGGCESSVKSAILSLNGVVSADVNLLGSYCNVEYNNQIISVNDIYDHLSKTRPSFQFSLPASSKTINILRDNVSEFTDTYRKFKRLLLISLLVSIPNSILNIIRINNNLLSSILAIISFTVFIQSKTKIPLVINVGIITSLLSGFIKIIAKSNSNCLAIHDFETSTMMISSFLLGKYLEARSKKIANDLMVNGISSFIPSTALKCTSIEKKEITVVPALVLNPGDICFLRGDEKIPADGVIIESYDCFVDESLLTGETIDVKKIPLDECFAGTEVKTGTAFMRVTSSDSDTRIGRIASIVADNTVKNKTNLKSKVDKLTSIFFPVVSAWSFAITVLWYISLKYGNIMKGAELARGGAFLVALNFGLSSLVVCCPCALSLAIPTAITIAVSIASRNHIILKNTNFLDKLKISTYVFDKSGTLTLGLQNVIETYMQPSKFEESDVYQIINLLEEFSTNKLGKSLTNFSKEKMSESINWKVKSVAVESNGIMADVVDIYNGVTHKVKIGAETFFSELLFSSSNRELINEAYLKGYTIVVVTIDELLVNILVIGDRLKPDAYDTIQYLHRKGIEVYIASGDNEATVQSIASQLNIKNDYAKGSLKSEDKVNLVKQLQASGRGVAFCGDGYNDCAPLSQSDLGISMSSGVELSLHSASLIIHKLSDIVKSHELINLLNSVINKNLLFALLYNILTIPIASGMLFRFGIVLNPSMCSLLMAASSFSIMISSYDMFRKFDKITK